MPFPSTPMLDRFTGADETPITTNWTTPLVTGDNSNRRLSNAFQGAAAGGFAGSWYDLVQFDADQEAYATISVLGTAVSPWARLQNPGTATPSGYLARWFSGNTVELRKVVAGAVSTIASGSGVIFSSGDGLGIRCVGTAIELWVRQSGVWSKKLETADGSIPNGGYIGMELNGATAVIDDFGGGIVNYGYFAEVLSDGPVVYYRMDEPSGQLQDYSGSALPTDAAINGTPTYSQPGPILSRSGSTGIRLDIGSSERFERSHNAVLNCGDTFTLEAWIKRLSTSGAREEAIIDKQGGGYGMYFNNDKLVLTKEGAGFIAESVYPNGSAFTISDTIFWHHCVVTKSGSSYGVYIDGINRTSAELTALTCVDTGASLFVGAETGPGSPVDAILAEVAVYPRVLPPARVQEHYRIALDAYDGADSAPVAIGGWGAA